MKKIMMLLVFGLGLSLFGQAQINPTTNEKLALANEEFKALLVSKFSLTEDIASKVILIENEFYNQIAAAGKESIAENRKKIHIAHVNRRASLLAIPLVPRMMEDVAQLSDQNRRKHKL